MARLEQLDAQRAMVPPPAQTNCNLSDSLWRKGVNSYLLALMSLQLSDLDNRVTLYRELGAV